MANSKLYDKNYKIPDEIVYFIKKIVNSYNGDKKIEGYTRAKKIIKDPIISYPEIKRIKNFLDNTDPEKEKISFNLNGGIKMKNFIDLTLKIDRNNVKNNKDNISNFKIDNKELDVNKNLKISDGDIYIQETLKIIKELIKN